MKRCVLGICSAKLSGKGMSYGWRGLVKFSWSKLEVALHHMTWCVSQANAAVLTGWHWYNEEVWTSHMGNRESKILCFVWLLLLSTAIFMATLILDEHTMKWILEASDWICKIALTTWQVFHSPFVFHCLYVPHTTPSFRTFMDIPVWTSSNEIEPILV